MDRLARFLLRSRSMILSALLHARTIEPTLSVAGAALVADPSGALYEPALGALIVADLHLEKGSSFARRGQFLPPYDTATTLGRLARLVETYRPRAVIALGDSFHDRGGPTRLCARDRASIAALQSGRDWIWIAGNHDPEPPAGCGGEAAAEMTLGPLTLRHEPSPGFRAGELAGHLHPVAKVAVRGRGLRRRCFATDGARVVLPAFGAYAGGLNVRDAAFHGLFAAGALTAWMLGETGVYAIAGHGLRPD
jgi:DNA ligase-associated metallophosphoesterase